MKKIITTVGTSIFSELKSSAFKAFEEIRNKSNSQWDNFNGKFGPIEDLKKEFSVNIFSERNEQLSAEITSILKIKETSKEISEVYLIASDTITSRLASELITSWFKKWEKEIKIHFNHEKDLIRGLQVNDKKQFQKEGVPNLLERLHSNDISNEGNYWQDCIFNITGGYKAFTPIITIVAQINRIPAYYIFQEQEDLKESKPVLLKIPQLPVFIDQQIFHKYYSEFILAANIDSKDKFSKDFLNECEDLLEFLDDNLVSLNEFCRIFWVKYLQNWFHYYAPYEIQMEIERSLNISRILLTKFCFLQQRKSQTETKGEHLVFDDGNNSNRIYYLEKDKNIYIYKIFEDHDAHEAYIPTKIDQNQIIKNSIFNKIKIN